MSKKKKRGESGALKKRDKSKRRKLIVSIALRDGVQVKQVKQRHVAETYSFSDSLHDICSFSGTQSDTNNDRPRKSSIEHRLTCLRHDHCYSQLRQDEQPLTKPLLSVLTPPPSAEPCEELPFSTQNTGVSNVAISPPLTPLSPERSPLLSRHFDLDSPQSSNDYPRSSSPTIPSPLSNAFKLQWSSASEAEDEVSKTSPLTTIPRQETNDPHRIYRGRKPYKSSRMSLNTLLSRWRKGPLPLPRSFSKRPSSTNSLLQTRAAKLESAPDASSPLENATEIVDIEGKLKLKRLSLSLKGKSRSLERLKSKKLKIALSPFCANDENHCDQATSSEPQDSQECDNSLEYVAVCAYKEQLMEWQYELNKQRDGTDDIIYVENDLDMVPPPTDFNYACSNVYTEGVPNPSHPEFSSSLCGCECYYLGRKCGPKSEYCCAHMAGSKYAYSPAGKVKVPPGTPIYECNENCSCPSDCTNRIVQLGRKMPLCIFRTNGRGWGVKTIEPIKPNTFVTEYVGEVITNEEAERRGKKCDAEGITYLFDLDFEDDNSAFTIDAAGMATFLTSSTIL